MNKIKQLSFVLFFLACPLSGHTQENYQDPFESLLLEPLPIEKEGEIVREESRPPSVIIEGILWGTAKPLAIINGEVYKTGDRIKDIDAKIFKIERKAVFVYYGNKIHKIGIKQGGI